MRRIAWLVLPVTLAVAGCAQWKDGETSDSVAVAALPEGHVPIPAARKGTALTPAAQALLDSANAEFRAGRHAQALSLYQAVSRDVPMHPASWFGTYMAARALGDSVLADSAMRMIRLRAPGVEGHPGGAGKGPPAPPASPHGAPAPHGSPTPRPGTP